MNFSLLSPLYFISATLSRMNSIEPKESKRHVSEVQKRVKDRNRNNKINMFSHSLKFDDLLERTRKHVDRVG